MVKLQTSLTEPDSDSEKVDPIMKACPECGVDSGRHMRGCSSLIRRVVPETLKTEQHGGEHYKGMAIQPAEYSQRNGLKWCEGEVVKLISRHQNKNGPVDVRKAIHYCKMVLEFEYGEIYDPDKRDTPVEEIPSSE